MPFAFSRPVLCVVAAALVLAVGPAVAQAPTPPIAVRDFIALTDLDALSVSPDGRWAAFLTRQADPEANAYRLAWHVAPLSGGAPRHIADGGVPIQPTYLGRTNGFMQNPAPVWSPDSRWIAFLRKDGGRTQIWRARIDGRRSEQLTHGAGDVRALVFSADGRLLYQTEPDQNQIAAALAEEGRAGFRYDERFFPSWSRWPTLPADARFNSDPRLTSDAQEALHGVFVHDVARRRSRLANELERAEFVALTRPPQPERRESFRGEAAQSRSSGQAWTEARDPDQQGGMAPLTIVAQRGDDTGPVVCAAAECTGQRIDGLWWRNGEEIIFARSGGVFFQDAALYAWRVGASSARLILRTAGLFVSQEWKCALAQDRLVCLYEESARPRRLIAIDLDDGRIETLFDPNPAFAGGWDIPPPQRVVLPAASGVETYGYLVLPPGHREGERHSLVIVTYRCSGFLRGGTGDEYPIFAFAAAGHAVLCFNVPEPDYARLATMDYGAYTVWSRGEGDHGKRRVQESLELAIAHLDRMGVIDPARVAVTGLSLGAETTTYALWNMPQLATAIASGTEFGPASTFLYGPAAREALATWGVDRLDSPRWATLSVTRNAGRVRAPYLLNVGDHEMMDALHPVTALQQAGRSVELFVFPNEYHIKWQPAHRLAIYNRNIDWTNFWLRGVESGLSGDATQYERWRAMRENQCRLFGPDGTERGPDEEPPWYCRPGALESAAVH